MKGPVYSIVQSVRAGTRTAREVVQQYLDTAEALDPDLNAFTELDRDGALQQADEVDRANRTGSLCGVPVAIKDLIDHAGHVTTAGSAFYRHRTTSSATVVDRLQAAGAIIIGRTGLHEFAYGFSSENPWHGVVRNPWDRALSPGGSSGGSAVAVAAGMAPAAIGTDTGGSVRVPAALCGLVGLKVTHGRIPLTGIFPLAESLDTVGPMARTTTDARLLYLAMAGFDPADRWSVAMENPPGRPPPTVEDLRIAIPGPWLDYVDTSETTRRTFDTICDEIRGLGARVEVVDSPALAPTPTLITLAAAEAASVHRRWFADPTRPYGQDLSDRLGPAMEITTDEYLEAVRWQARMVQAARRLFVDHDLLLTPAVGHPRKRIGVDTIEISGKPIFYRNVLAGYTALVNVVGCPAISLPIAGDGVPPPAIQLIAPWWQERILLEVGEQLERTGLVVSPSPPS